MASLMVPAPGRPLLYLQTQAVRTGSREVELGRSMRDWMERMGLSVGGETARSLREQAGGFPRAR